MKWAGFPATFESAYPDLLQKCSPNRADGTQIPTFDRTLREGVGATTTVVRKYRPLFSEIDRWLDDPQHAVVLLYWASNNPTTEGHYTLIPEKTADSLLFRFANDGPHSFHTRATLKRYVRNRSRAKIDLPVAWFLERSG